MKRIELDKLFHEENVFLDLEARDGSELIRKTCQLLADREGVLDSGKIADDAIIREEELPTGLEHGIAMPHARTRGVDRLVCAIVKPVEPISFSAPDGSLARVIFFTAIPQSRVDDYLHLTAALIRRIHQRTVLEGVLNASTEKELLASLLP